jgi:hypothetical protein
MVLQDTGSGTVARRGDFATFPGTTPMSRMSPLSATQHSFTVLLAGSACNSGSGINVNGASLDVISTR